jgi:hypothetical protein
MEKVEKVKRGRKKKVENDARMRTMFMILATTLNIEKTNFFLKCYEKTNPSCKGMIGEGKKGGKRGDDQIWKR